MVFPGLAKAEYEFGQTRPTSSGKKLPSDVLHLSCSLQQLRNPNLQPRGEKSRIPRAPQVPAAPQQSQSLRHLQFPTPGLVKAQPGAILSSQAVLLLLIPAKLPLDNDPEAKGGKGTLPPEGSQSNTATK